MSRRHGKCVECGGIYGHHMTGCPETPDAPDGEEIENDEDQLESMETEDINDE